MYQLKIATKQQTILGDAMLYFLIDDYNALCAQIDEVTDRIKAIGQEVGLSCQEGAETFHDNFAYEEGQRQQAMWSKRLKELIDIRNISHLTPPSTKKEKVFIGNVVTCKNISTGEVKTYTIGSFMVLKEKDGNTISYASPIGKMLMGAKKSNVRKGEIAGKIISLKILKIEAAQNTEK